MLSLKKISKTLNHLPKPSSNKKLKTSTPPLIKSVKYKQKGIFSRSKKTKNPLSSFLSILKQAPKSPKSIKSTVQSNLLMNLSFPPKSFGTATSFA